MLYKIVFKKLNQKSKKIQFEFRYILLYLQQQKKIYIMFAQICENNFYVWLIHGIFSKILSPRYWGRKLKKRFIVNSNDLFYNMGYYFIKLFGL